MGTKYPSRSSRSCSAAQIETLEQRCLLSHPALQYSVIDIGALLGANTIPTAINSSGYVIGYRNVSGVTTAFAYSRFHRAHHFEDEVALFNGYTSAEAINDQGLIVARPPRRGAVLTGTGSVTNIYAPGTVGHSGINDSGVVAGTYTDTFLHNPTAFVSVNGQSARAIGEPGDSAAYAINDAGLVAGTNQQGATLFDPNDHRRNVQIGNQFNYTSVATDVNQHGDATGHYDAFDFIGPGAADFAFLYKDGQMHRITTTSAFRNVEPTALNDSDVIVGQMSVTNRHGFGVRHAFVYVHGKVRDLNSLIPSASGVALTIATDVNDSGEIVCAGLVNGRTHAFILRLVG